MYLKVTLYINVTNKAISELHMPSDDNDLASRGNGQCSGGSVTASGYGDNIYLGRDFLFCV